MADMWFRATIKLKALSGIEADASINVWHFYTDAAVQDEQAQKNAIALFLPTFYINGANQYLSPAVSRTTLAHDVAVARVNINAPGADDDVIDEATHYGWGLGLVTPPDDPPLPSEVAVAFSFRGDITGLPEEQGLTRPAARKRGRVFVGPLNTAALAVDASNRCYVAPQFATDLNDSYQAFVASLNSVTPSIYHGVYSPTSGTGAIVVQASVDDAFDTIRSRGQASLARTSWPVAQ